MGTTSKSKKDMEIQVKNYGKKITEAKEELSKIFVGQEEMVHSLFEALLCNGHVLIEGIPGIGKTLLVRSLAEITGCSYSRIQFTPDLLPTDIVGITTYDQKRGFHTIKGPVFANFVLGDEINRSPPKVQSALLEAMAEKQVTIGKNSYDLESPFFVMATQNPLEQLGTYQLPEAQLDRFLFKTIMRYPSNDEELVILERNLGVKSFSEFNLKKVLTKKDLLDAQKLASEIVVEEKVKKYIVRLVDATRRPEKYKLESAKYMAFGASPRASIGLYVASKAKALVKGKTFVTPEEVKEVAHNVLRHRIIVNFEGQAENISTDSIINELLAKVNLL